MFRDLATTEFRRDRSDAGVPAHSSKQYSIELWRKFLETAIGFDFARKDLDRWMLFSLQLAFEVSFAMWWVQERSWLMVRARFNRMNLFQWIIKEIDRWVCPTILLER